MRKAKVGVYVFTHSIMKRSTKSRENYFDGLNYIGLRYIVSEIDRDMYDVSYVSADNVNSVDFVLVSLTSYYDVLNVISELYGKKIKPTVLIGGAGCNNVGLLRCVGDVITVGRGEETIMRILAGDHVDGIWYRDADPDLKGTVDILPPKKLIEMDDKYLGTYEERSVGCPRRCAFCEYGWKHPYYNPSGRYESGIIERETLFSDVDFSSYANRDLVTAIDGQTEETRKVAGKPISNADITEKLMEIYDQENEYVSLKLYCMVGYPWETAFYPDEFVECVARARRSGGNRLNILVVSPHFMPMPFTPMENEPVNWHNFREDIKKHGNARFVDENIGVYWNWSLASSPMRAAEATVLNRADLEDAPAIKAVLCSSAYRGLNFVKKRIVLERYFGHLLGRVDSVLPYVNRINDVEKGKERYRSRLEKYRALNGGPS